MSELADHVARSVLEGDIRTMQLFASKASLGPREALNWVRRNRPPSADAHTLLLLDQLARLVITSSPDGVSVADLVESAIKVREASSGTLRESLLVWTGPDIHESALRSTSQAMRELIANAESQILISTYSIRPDSRDASASLIGQLAAARRRGVYVTMILHHTDENRAAVIDAWDASAPLPRIVTWPIDDEDQMVKLHAKIMAVDDRYLLLTSANLTYHGMFANLEMGVVLESSVAGDVRRHFDRLERNGYLTEWLS